MRECMDVVNARATQLKMQILYLEEAELSFYSAPHV